MNCCPSWGCACRRVPCANTYQGASTMGEGNARPLSAGAPLSAIMPRRSSHAISAS
jgi:hypothetical protein